MPTPNELINIISSGERFDSPQGAGDDRSESEAGPPDGLFSGPSQKWSSPPESPVNLLTQDDTVDPDAAPPLG